MKRIVTLLLAAGLVLGASGAGQAADIKAKGMWDFSFNWTDQTFFKGNRTNPAADERGRDFFNATQRLRAQIDIIASENLKGVVMFEMGDTEWGTAGAQGGSLGTDGISVEVKYSYIDWVVPGTDLKVRMGLQPIGLPAFVADSAVLGGGAADGAGITLSYAFTENVGVTVFWDRLLNGNENDRFADTGFNDTVTKDTMDLAGFTVPLTFDGVKVTPWFAYANIGRDALTVGGAQRGVMNNGLRPWGVNPIGSNKYSGDAFWVGLTGDITMFNPFRVAFDFNYGSLDFGDDFVALDGRTRDLERRGWMAALLAEYKLDFVTPGILAWYSSGANASKDYDGRMPTIRGGWNVSTYGWDGGVVDKYDMFGVSPVGTWAVYLRAKDITFIDDLKHTLQVGYLEGTNKGNDRTAALIGFTGSNQGFNMTSKDNAVEVNFDSTYKIYDNLTATLSLGYIYLNLDDKVWGEDFVDETSKHNFKAALNMRYTF